MKNRDEDSKAKAKGFSSLISYVPKTVMLKNEIHSAIILPSKQEGNGEKGQE